MGEYTFFFSSFFPLFTPRLFTPPFYSPLPTSPLPLFSLAPPPFQDTQTRLIARASVSFAATLFTDGDDGPILRVGFGDFFFRGIWNIGPGGGSEICVCGPNEWMDGWIV